jgi:hypothetical protein
VFRVTAHVWRTQDGRLVGPGDPDAAFLAYAPGTEIPDAEARRTGLDVFTAKAQAKPADKSAPRAADKSATFTKVKESSA